MSIRTQLEEPTPQSFREDLGNSVGLDMVLIPGGSFMMGSPLDEPQRHNCESPQHHVTVQPFYMGPDLVTQAQWEIVAGWKPIESQLKLNTSEFKGDRHPVDSVSWHDAVEFCARLSAKTGRQYGLPSEAEWEYACRAGTITPFYHGATITPDLACYKFLVYRETPGEKQWKRSTTPVRTFPANAWGLYDMHGNVWEWCADVWHGHYRGAPTDGSAWLDQRADIHGMVRGGSWASPPRDCRSAARGTLIPDFHKGAGFRVVYRLPRT